MNSRTKIKVNREALIERIRDRQRDKQAQYEEALAEYHDRAGNFASDFADALEDLANEVREGRIDPEDCYSWNGRVSSDRLPDRPREPTPPRDMTNAIAQLEIAADDTVTISGEDFAAYMK